MSAPTQHYQPTPSSYRDSYLPIIAANAGWTTDFIEKLNYFDPDELIDGTEELSFLLKQCKDRGLAITIWPDYDMDGIAAGTVLYAGLSQLGFNVHMIVPNYVGSRELVAEDVDKILAQFPDTKLIMTCDGGINSNSGIDYAHSLGIPVIVTDHHHENDEPSHADVAVNPNCVSSTFSNKDICGAQVAHMVLTHYARTYAPEHSTYISYLKVFAGIGAIADVMPMRAHARKDASTALSLLALCTPDFERNYYGNIDQTKNYVNVTTSVLNTLIVQNQELHPAFRDAFAGLIALISELGLHGKIYDDFDETFIGFTVAPMFNATRRIEADMRANMMVFTPSVVAAHNSYYRTDDLPIDQNFACRTLLNNNDYRKKLVVDLLNDIANMPQPYQPHIYVAPDYASAGMLGLLASDLLKNSGAHATCVVRENFDENGHYYSGSARSIDIDMLELSHETDDLIAQGHAYACGVRITDLEEVAAIMAQASEDAESQQLDMVQPCHLHLADLLGENCDILAHTFDAMTDVDLPALINTVSDLDRMRPFGHGFDYPIIDITINPAQCRILHLGKEQKHTKITAPSGLTLIKWNTFQTGEHEVWTGIAEKNKTTPSDRATLLKLRVELALNTFAGNINVQAIVKKATCVPLDPA